MRVQFMENVWEYPNELASVGEMFERLEDSLGESQLYISHIVVDGTEVYNDYQEYLSNNILNIQDVIVVATTLVEMVKETLLSTQTYLDRALPELQLLVNQFYQGPSRTSWDKFTQLLDGLQWILGMIRSIHQVSGEGSEWSEFTKVADQIEEALAGMQDAVVNTDAVLLADVLHYEITPVLAKLREVLGHTLLHKVVSKHVN